MTHHGTTNRYKPTPHVFNWVVKSLNAAFLAVVALGLDAATVLETDFTTLPPSEVFTLKTKHGTVADGQLSLGDMDGKCHDSASFATKLNAPFVISFTVRVKGFSAPDHHWGLTFLGSKGDGCSFGSRNDGSWGLWISKNRKITEKRGFPGNLALPVGQEQRMVPVELQIMGSFAELKVDGRPMGTARLDLTHAEGPSFYAYNTAVQLDDLKVVELDKKAYEYAMAPVFSLDFDHGVNATDENGREIAPQAKIPPVLEPGVKGQALSLLRRNPEAPLVYDVGPLLGDAGAVMFWSSPRQRVSDAVRLLTADGKERLSCRPMGFAFAASFVKPDGSKFDFTSRGNKWLLLRNDWNHYAVTWDKNGAVRIFRNGLPYRPSNSWEPNVAYSSGLDLSDVRQIVLLPSDTRLDGLNIYRREVKPQEVYADFRKASPLDVVIPAAVVQPTDDAAVTVRFAPGGTYTRPAHGSASPIGAKGELTLALYPLGDDVDTPLKTLTRQLAVEDKAVDVNFPVGKLPEGEYRVQWSLKTSEGILARRSVGIECRSLPEAITATPDDVKLGRVVFERKFTDANAPELLKQGKVTAVDGRYLEAGGNKGDRFAVVVPNLGDYIQKPLVLEVAWPDDKQRMMGLYMYIENKKGECYRDRLQGGVQAGRELPNSGEIARSRYLFYPQSPTYLFEARTLANGFPAAVSELKLYEVEGGALPKLAINYPKGMEHRRVGNADEDQTLATNMARASLPELTERIMDYLDYTGQDSFHYAITRYYFSFFPLPGALGNDMYPWLPGGMDYVIDACAKRGKKFVGIFNLNTIPEIYYANTLGLDLADSGMISRDKDSLSLETCYGAELAGAQGKANIANPEVRQAILRYLKDFEDSLKKPGFDGISVWWTLGWSTLEDGYDDYTVNKFAEESGVKVPKEGRYEFLTAPGVLPVWSKWRAKQVFLLLKGMRETLDRINPAVKLYVLKRCETDWDPYLDEMLKPLKNVFACDMRRPTQYRHGFHWGSPENDFEERIYDDAANRKLIKRKSNEMVTLFYNYYETFTKPLDRNYGCYFQDADVKPAGRQFLKELAFNVASSDILEIAMGGQPFGSFGRDAETREFAKAFAALPHESFKDVPGCGDSVVARYLPSPNGTYFYVVNTVWTDAAAKLDFSAPVEYRDLSTDSVANDGLIELKPFQLRSFLVPDKEVAVTAVKASFPAKLNDFYAKRIAELDKALSHLEERNIRLPEERACLARLKACVGQENYAEAHRLAFCRLLNQLLEKAHDIENVVKREEMTRANVFAVDCGSDKFYQAPNGKLFFPDQKFEGDATYGYFGKNKSVTREIDKLKDKETPLLYQSEAYDLDGYKFKLANGLYKLRLYMKIGYPDNFVEGNTVFTVYAQGKPLFVDKDFFLAGEKDFGKPIVMDFDDIKVTDGLLTLKFEMKKGFPSDRKLCDGIEIIPAQK